MKRQKSAKKREARECSVEIENFVDLSIFAIMGNLDLY